MKNHKMTCWHVCKKLAAKNRLVERDIADWLYCRYLAPKVAENVEFNAEVQDVMRAGLRVQLARKWRIAIHSCCHFAQQQRRNTTKS
ncbi:ribonuclease II [Haemophilus influenzae]|uniref:Ribonuclease II n=1 Tax=Haemophilus influenzae TaxID=727 RepID=A0A2X1PHQ7_HAEIF|nr:ribonuclease II [Haemophilus influenzae]